jgi:flagellar basal-body rod modification protein FlgD
MPRTAEVQGMTAPLGNNAGPIPTSLYTNKTTTDAGTDKKLGDQDTFLKLLVAQLKYQDPSNPADSTQFLAQTAQFTQVEKLAAIAESQASMLAAQQSLSASNLVGRTIAYTDAAGAEQTGVVTKATLGGSDPTLTVGNTDVPLSSVKDVRQSS